MKPLDDVDYPTMVSNCQSIADWEAALQHGTIDVNAVDERGMNGLHYAVRRGQLNLVKYLVSRNADLSKPTEDTNGDSVLHLAVESGDINTLQFLVSKNIAIDTKNRKGETAVHLAVHSGRLVQLTFLLRSSPNSVDIQDAEGRTPIHVAILFGSYNTMKQIMTHRPNVFLYDATGFLPIHQALLTANPHALLLLAEYDFKQFSKLTKKGDRLLTLATECGDEVCLQVVRQYASMTNFPSWFKTYMWSISAASWVAIFIVASLFLNFWIIVIASAFAIRTLYNLTTSEHYKNSRNPIMASGIFAGSIMAIIAYFWWIWSFASSEHPWLSLLIIPLFLATLELYRRVYLRDPGYHSYSADDTVHFANSSAVEAPPPTLCETCLGDRPLRTKHCSKCERCVDEAQHHCAFLNVCVAKNTHGTFLAFLVSAAFTLLLWLSFAIPYFNSIMPDDTQLNYINFYSTLRSMMDLNGAITILVIGGLAALVYTSYFIALHIKLISQNLTAYENANWQRYPYLLNEAGQFQNLNDRGISGNVRLFLDNWLGKTRPETSKSV
jgi:hypothetical protein